MICAQTENFLPQTETPIRSEHLADFIQCYRTDAISKRKETADFRRFKYSEIITRGGANLDIQWHDENIATTKGKTHQALMKEILKDLKEAMREFAAVESKISEQIAITKDKKKRKIKKNSKQGKEQYRLL